MSVGEKLAKEYLLGPELASGGMAQVYLARRLGPARFSPVVAVKRMHPSVAKDPSLAKMFADEARLAAHVRHPNVVPTLDVIALEDELALVMEYIHGAPLSALAHEASQADELVPIPIATAIVFGLLCGLHAAHEATDEEGKPLGIVHRDVSPQNVLVGLDGVTRVADFGIARAIGQIHTTREGHVKGKLAYMAPEQLSAGRLDRRADLYAAAIVLWELLTLQRLFVGESDAELLGAVAEGASERPSTHRPDIPPALDALVMRALARDPTRRFGTAQEMATALEKCGPLATPLEVGAWVKSTARRLLAKRDEQLAAVRALTAPDEPPSAPAPPPRTSRKTWYVVAGSAALLLGVTGAVFARAHPKEPPAPPPPLPSPSASTATPPDPPLPDEPALPASAASTTKPPRAPQRRRDPCDPPYWTDAKNIRHYKVECAGR